ncbi:MYND-type domain-containing protein [Mycena kentingensis (nom. inval.)]|nr:MYND-type domain-containing protein [Mycena kentingensis (nom. inval.)]
MNACVCFKAATSRCAACKTVAYCSPECQRADWGLHKIQCKITQKLAPGPPPEGAMAQIQELVRVGGQHTIFQEVIALGLNPDTISGSSGADMYAAGAERQRSFSPDSYWRLDEEVRKYWDVKAEETNRKARRFWMSYLAPLTLRYEWVDIVLEAILNMKLPAIGPMVWQNQWTTQVGANIIAGLFPHLHRFTPAQNTTLLDIFASPRWHYDGTFRLEVGTTVLFGHGRPNPDFIDQIVSRCLSWTRPYSEIDKLICCIAIPIQKCWPEAAGTKLLDTALAMLTPGRPGSASGRTVPGDKILELAKVSPAACKHLLPAIHVMCRARGPPMISEPDNRILAVCESFGISMSTGLVAQLKTDFRFCSASTKRLEEHTKADRAGKLAKLGYGIVVQDHSLAELRALNREAMDRLGNIQGS